MPHHRDRANPRDIGTNDALGDFSLTAIDALSTLAVMAASSEADAQRFWTAVHELVRIYWSAPLRVLRLYLCRYLCRCHCHCHCHCPCLCHCPCHSRCLCLCLFLVSVPVSASSLSPSLSLPLVSRLVMC